MWLLKLQQLDSENASLVVNLLEQSLSELFSETYTFTDMILDVQGEAYNVTEGGSGDSSSVTTTDNLIDSRIF